MANTYTQIHLQAVIGVKFRASVIAPQWKERLHQYITGIVQNNSHKMLSINSMPDHLHLFFGFRPTQSLADLMRLVKGESSEWINRQKWTPSVFRWQEGYGAFSYARSQVKTVARYIENQEAHHRKKTFLEEYKEFLSKFEVEFDERYIFKSLSDKCCPDGARFLLLIHLTDISPLRGKVPLVELSNQHFALMGQGATC
jgi:REP element-mobilizing transposase RayT